MIGRLAAPAATLLLVTAGLVLGVSAPSQARSSDWGTVSATDGKLRKGCRTKAYTYAITPPEGDWALETFLIDPRGRKLGSGVLLGGHDATQGRASFRICRATTRPGKFRIRALLSVQNGPVEYQEEWLATATFRMRKR
ncbi:hypothetical protein [Nocardioides pantholopis]|uniref:hypothetical protein n=1 Tax=Nocardioides pantholopis TaxID=2483798 RepID=UPI000FDB0685|nr:hypothetical protein [Nocardioides pantholopis]